MRVAKTALVVCLVVLLVGVGFAEEETEGKKKKKQSGVRKGAIIGGATGLALGALTGDAGLAAKGAAAGAATGAASGAWYDYDQSRQDDRTQMLADSIAGPKASEAAPGDTVGDVGNRHLADLRGEWKVDIWVLGAEGDRIPAKGVARGLAEGENATRVHYRDIKIEGIDDSLDGSLLVKYDPGQGFFLENTFSTSDEALNFVGEYLADKNAYNYYLMNNTEGEMLSGGHRRSSLRLEIRISNPSLWVAETYTHIDGKEVQVQSYRFMK